MAGHHEIAELARGLAALRQQVLELAALLPSRAEIARYRLPASADCEHTAQRIVARGCGDGSIQVRHLCPDCWRSGRAIPGRLVPRRELLQVVSGSEIDAGRRAFDMAQRDAGGAW